LRRLAKSEEGFGLIELLIAMTVMVVAIMAIVAAFDSGMVTLNRASRTSTAGTLADMKMEEFRKVAYNSIAPICASGASTGCSGTDTKTGPDGRTYQRAWGIWLDCPVGTLGGTPPTCTGAEVSRPVKRVTIIVSGPAIAPFSETSTFDQATG
jgi:type II secretory pathway pseudopilin PulG